MCERTYTKEEMIVINKVKSESSRICYYCNKTIPEKETASIDHKMPVSKGGPTIEENLVIACMPCNQEKDDMTEEEYLIYKQKQDELFTNNEVTLVIDELVTLSDNIISRTWEINNELANVENKLILLQQDIMLGTHNACEGYKLTIMLKGLLLRREELKILKCNYSRLNTLLGNHKKGIIEVRNKIQVDIKKNNKLFLKRYVTIILHNKKSKVVNINKLMQTAR